LLKTAEMMKELFVGVWLLLVVTLGVADPGNGRPKSQDTFSQTSRRKAPGLY